MKYAVTFLALAVLISACKPELTVAPTPTSDIINTDAEINAHPKGLDFGDVEQTVFMEIEVLESAIPEGAKPEELRTSSHKRLTMMTLDIEGPEPAELPVSIIVKTQTDFTERPVALRGKVLRQLDQSDPEEIFTFNTLIDGAVTFRRGELPEPRRFPFYFTFNGREGLTEMPDTMLLYIEAEAVLMDLGTDKDTVDPATAMGDKDNMGDLLSNALRVNYTATEATNPEPIPADAAPADATPTDATPTDATPTDATPTEAVPTDATPTEAVPTDATAAEAASPTEASATP